jgi:hypothetical protein
MRERGLICQLRRMTELLDVPNASRQQPTALERSKPQPGATSLRSIMRLSAREGQLQAWEATPKMGSGVDPVPPALRSPHPGVHGRGRGGHLYGPAALYIMPF